MFAAGKTKGASAATAATYIEDVFSTWLYTGNGSTQTITNGIDLSGNGGLVWLKCRNSPENNEVYDTVRGANQRLITNTTGAQVDRASSMAFSSTGLSWVGTNISNTSGETYVSWTFRKQPKFFDVVTYTGNGVAGRTVAHNLGSVPGFMIVKSMGTARNWTCYHRSLGATNTIALNLTSAASAAPNDFNSTAPTDTVFTVGSDASLNANGVNYVAYLFAHNAGGFGLTGTDNVISCSSFTTDGSGAATVNLGYEPQWVMIKNTTSTGGWYMFDTMRGMPTPPNAATLFANLSGAEGTQSLIEPNATGFAVNSLVASATYIYIAIRRGPMKTPTSGTSVFSPISTTAAINSTTPATLTPEASDWWMNRSTGTSSSMLGLTRLTNWGFLATNSASAEDTSSYIWTQKTQSDLYPNLSFRTAVANVRYFFKRAPGFFDVVCYTTGAGTGQTTFSHNLGVTPELVISKVRSDVDDWYVYAQPLGTSKTLYLNSTVAQQTLTCTNSLSATSATTYLGVGAATAVSYLFASCPGVSKVGSYTGTGATQTISCGFAARFVLIKRTDSTGDWWVWDTARGMVAGTDPRLQLNSASAEINANWVYTNASGFQIVTTNAGVNASGGNYIYLAIA